MLNGANEQKTAHYLVGHYTTHRVDGVHIEARCTCGKKLEGIGDNEGAAMDSLWAEFSKHSRGVCDDFGNS